jgi:hypothetical protein
MTIEQQAMELQKLKLGELRAKFRELVGADTKSNNRPYLIKKILVAAQSRKPAPAEPKAAEQAPGETKRAPGETKRARKRAERDPRLPAAGTVLEREHDGKTIKVKVLDDGFLFRNKTYRSLSAIAKEATGTVWNGWLFFNLIKRPVRETTASN